MGVMKTPAAFPPSLRLVAALLAPALAACGNMTIAVPPAPRFIPGGGLGDGPINGALNVYVADDDTRAPVSGATVRVGGSSDPAACSATTDSTGLALFEKKTCALLDGKQSITASSTDYAPTTWIGVDAANVTLSIKAKTPAAVDTAIVTGTIAGWDALPAPAAQHSLLGIVGYSASSTMSDAANNLVQDMRTVHAMVAGMTIDAPVPSNACVRNLYVDDCTWRLKTRTGAQAHYAIVLDQDGKGTDDKTDDTFTVIGWAIKTGLSFQKDVGADGETLTLLTDDQMQPFTAMFPSAPSGLDYLQAYPMLDLGDAGRLAIILPALDATHTMTRVPKLTGALASAHYDFVAKAQDAMGQDQPATLSWSHAVDPSKTVAALAWTPAPTALMAAGGTYSFGAVPGATLQGAELQTMAGQRAWSITIFDGTTSFTLPGVSPDPLAPGPSLFVASALVLTDFNPADAKIDDLRDKLTHLASDQLKFMH
jgi:hypothetical protein